MRSRWPIQCRSPIACWRTRVLIRVPRLELETQTAGPLFAAAGSEPGAVCGNRDGCDRCAHGGGERRGRRNAGGDAVSQGNFEVQPGRGKFGSLRLGPGGVLVARLTAVVPAKYLTITAGGLVVILLVIGLSHRRHRQTGRGEAIRKRPPGTAPSRCRTVRRSPAPGRRI